MGAEHVRELLREKDSWDRDKEKRDVDADRAAGEDLPRRTPGIVPSTSARTRGAGRTARPEAGPRRA
jgi:hypothetical protein